MLNRMVFAEKPYGFRLRMSATTHRLRVQLARESDFSKKITRKRQAEVEDDSFNLEFEGE